MFLGLIAGLALPRAAAALEATPSRITIGPRTTVELRITGLPGQGPASAEVNVGAVERVEESGDRLVLHYRPPAQQFPQILLLALWRGEKIDSSIHFLRLPLQATVELPIETRPASQVKVRVGNRRFGPFSSGPTGKIKIPVLVPPDVRSAWVEVTDEAGLQSQRQIGIAPPPPYNLLTMVITPRRSSAGAPRFRITLDTAEDTGKPTLVQIGDELFHPVPRPAGGTRLDWTPPRRPQAGQVSLRAWIADRPQSVRYAQIGISPQTLAVRTLRVRPRTGWEPPREGLRGDLGLAVGLLHNFGDLVAPRVVLEVGLDYPLPWGRFGGRLFCGFSYGSQTLTGPEDLPGGKSTLMLFPLGAGVLFRMPRFRLSPYALAGALAQIVRASNTAAYAPERLRFDVVPGGIFLLGIEPRLGSGRAFLQAGLLWSRVDNEDVRALVGGVIIEGGYRLGL